MVSIGKRLQAEPVAPRLPTTLVDVSPSATRLEDDGIYSGLRYVALDLSEQDVEHVEFDACQFRETSLSRTLMRRSGLADAEIGACDLANLRLGSCTVFSSVIDGSRMTGASFTDCGLRDVLITNCRAQLASFRFSRLAKVVFRDCDLTESNFQNANFDRVRFERCNLSGAQFSNAVMRGTVFSGCDLRGVKGVESLRGATVSAADAHDLLYALASALGIAIEPED